jgi:hypothetical protein
MELAGQATRLYYLSEEGKEVASEKRWGVGSGCTVGSPERD